MKMLRQNVLVDLGGAIAPWDESIIVAPGAYKRVNVKGRIVSVAGGCRLFNEKDFGRTVVVEPVEDLNRRMSPDQAAGFGLRPSWHVIAHENNVQIAIDE